MNVLKYPDEWFKAMFEEGCAQVAGKQCSLVVWHPYPEEEPTDEDVPSDKQFLCYTDDGKYAVYHRRPNWSDDGVVAWAEIPNRMRRGRHEVYFRERHEEEE